MSNFKPAVPKGTRDFLPEQYARRAYIFSTIETIFKTYGFKPIETPAMELLSTLTGKYGDEGDKLIFKILNSGDFISGVNPDDYAQKNPNRLVSQLCEKALRYDLTVPFARFVVQHFNDITLPFRRYQMQPVWRADRPQKGRYREFYQCDVDIIGSNALINEAELIKITDDIFSKLGIRVIIKLNNRKVLAGIAEVTGAGDKLTDLTVALDKLDKTSWDSVKEELKGKQFPDTALSKIEELVLLTHNATDLFQAVSIFINDSETGRKGLAELREIRDYAGRMNLRSEVIFDVTLARGLNYYTGAIFEVKALDTDMGSISGGGRYDDLTGIFGMKDMSGVGISYGADRIYDVLEKLNLFPDTLSSFTRVLIANLGSGEVHYALPLLMALRQAGIPSEIFPDEAKMKKQLAYADKLNVPYVVIAGSDEMKKGIFILKNMKTGQQMEYTMEEIVKTLS